MFAGNSNLVVYSNFASGNGWQVYGNNKSSTDQLLNAYAICLSGTSGTTQQLVNQVTIAGNGSGHSVMACPTPPDPSSGDSLRAKVTLFSGILNM